MIFTRPIQTYPLGDAPSIDWTNPLTQGLVGLLWTGTQVPYDLVTGKLAKTTNSLLTPTEHGPAHTVTTAGSNGVYYDRLDNAAWRVVEKATFAFFGNITPTTSARTFAGCTDGSSGYLVRIGASSRARDARLYIGGVSKSSTAGTWADKDCIRSITYDGANVDFYDDGVSYATVAATGTISYGATFTRVGTFGNPDTTGPIGRGCYQAIWDRSLSEAEQVELNNNPWQLFFSGNKPVPLLFTAASGSYSLIANSGSYSYTGQIATLLKTKVLSAGSGSYTISGQTATILKSKVLTASAGSYAYTGQSATISYVSGGTTYTLIADPGTYTYDGQTATLKKSKVLSASSGTYAISGQNATLAYSGANTITLKAGSWLRYRIIS